jgi:hypothetical protein
MTKQEAIEKCGKALMRRRGYNEDQWKDQPHSKEFAEELIESLEALGLFKASDQ